MAAIPIVKAHAYGNDFLYVRNDAAAGVEPRALARAVCDRHRGIGADGLILYSASTEIARARMRLINSDGSDAEVSGNGVRGLAAILARDQQLREPGAIVHVDTDAGQKALTLTAVDAGRFTFSAAMGRPVDVRRETLHADRRTIDVVTLSMGNPQCVVLGPLPDRAEFVRLGPALERHPHFPDGTNVEFAHVEAPRDVRILIWERGAGETLSSGTGSCAAAVAAATFAGAARDVLVTAPGGTQHVEWTGDEVFLTGWAEIVLDGLWVGPTA